MQSVEISFHRATPGTHAYSGRGILPDACCNRLVLRGTDDHERQNSCSLLTSLHSISHVSEDVLLVRRWSGDDIAAHGYKLRVDSPPWRRLESKGIEVLVERRIAREFPHYRVFDPCRNGERECTETSRPQASQSSGERGRSSAQRGAGIGNGTLPADRPCTPAEDLWFGATCFLLSSCVQTRTFASRWAATAPCCT
jgi:hypothetical protein